MKEGGGDGGGEINGINQRSIHEIPQLQKHVNDFIVS